jgi:antitoxin (DNA-binding transcriptional repressor) of toxin-antitoxin stability system
LRHEEKEENSIATIQAKQTALGDDGGSFRANGPAGSRCAAGGQEVTITSDGKPKAVLSPVGKRQSQKVFMGTWEQLKKMPIQTEGPFAEEIIRADRDGRGW